MSSGFTIIETTLFLAVSGLLVLGMLVGIGVSLSNQRYRDAVYSFRDILQNQYADVMSVQSSRPGNLSCITNGSNLQIDDNGAGEPIGQSSCVVVGRYMRIDTNGLLTTYNVLAREIDDKRLNDIESLRQNYILGVDISESNDAEMEWDTEISWPKSGSGMQAAISNRTMGILVVRSPDSGRVYTFTTNTIPTDKAVVGSAYLKSFIIAGDSIPGQGDRTICVNSENWTTPDAMAVHIESFAAGASAVQIRTNQTALDIGAALKSFPSKTDPKVGPSQC
jgi:type II secretory pathway pseudopilin PulG